MAQRGKSAHRDGDDDDEREKSPAASEHHRGARYRKRSARGEGFVDSDVAFSQAQADGMAPRDVSPSPPEDDDDRAYLPKDYDSEGDGESSGDGGRGQQLDEAEEDEAVDVELVVRGLSWKDATKETVSVARSELNPRGLLNMVHLQEGLASIDAKDVFLLPSVDRKSFGCIPLSQAAIDRQLSDISTKNQGLRKGAKPYILRVGVVRGKAAAAEAKEAKEREKKEKKEKAKETKSKSKAARAKDNEHEEYLNQLITTHGIHPFGGRYSQAKLHIWAEAIVAGTATLKSPPKGLVPDNLTKEEKLAQTVASAVSGAMSEHDHHHHTHSRSRSPSPPPHPRTHSPAHSHSHSPSASHADTDGQRVDHVHQHDHNEQRASRSHAPAAPSAAVDVIFKVGGSQSFPTPSAVPMKSNDTVHHLLLAVMDTHAQLGFDAQQAFFVGIGLPSGHVLSPTTPLHSLLHDGKQSEPLSLIERVFELTVTAVDQSGLLPVSRTSLSLPFAALARNTLYQQLQHVASQLLPAGRPLLNVALTDGTNISAVMWHSAEVLSAQKWHNIFMWY